MIDLRKRGISFKLDDTWYLVSFKTIPFGRVADVNVSQSKKRSGFYFPSGAEVDRQNITAAEALKTFWQSMEDDVKAVLRRFFQKRLSK